MTSLVQDLLAMMERIAASMALPAVRRFEFAPATVPGCKSNSFAYLALDDGSIGLTYVALDDALADLQAQMPGKRIVGCRPEELAQLYAEPQGWQRALGLAAINAISQCVLSNHQGLRAMPRSLPPLALQAGDEIGMVGYFGRLVEPIRALGIPLTVIELDERHLANEPGVVVTTDATRLARCNKVIVTGTTLLNHTLEHILRCCTRASDIVLLGPSASCLPDPLFARGVTMIGGFRVTDAEWFAMRWQAAERWRDGGLRSGWHARNTPGCRSCFDGRPSGSTPTGRSGAAIFSSIPAKVRKLRPVVQARCSGPLFRPAVQTRCSDPLFRPASSGRCISTAPVR